MRQHTGHGQADDPQAQLEELLVECLAAVEDSGLEGLERSCSRHPEHAAALRRRIAALRRCGLLEPIVRERTPPRRLGEFEILGPLGSGGMGLVYRARQLGLGREVALKLVRPELLEQPGMRARFRREIDALARLAHPHLVAVHALGEHEGVPYLAMERVHGATLAEVLAQLRGELAGRSPAELRGDALERALETCLRRSGGIAGQSPKSGTSASAGRAAARPGRSAADSDESWSGPHARTHALACARIARETALALEHAHRAGILHRDLKPSNVLLGLDGRARLFDFGLALAEEGDALTRTGTVVGSLPYMPPEQALGEALDARADVYGLAATLHELLTLQAPFPEKNPVRLRAAILAGGAPSARRLNRAVPRELELVLSKALERDRKRRYASAADFALDLENVLESRPVHARPAGAIAGLRRWARRRPATAAALAVAGIAAIAAPSALAIQREQSRARIERALEQAQAEGARAERNLDAALLAVADMLGVFADEVARESPLMGERSAQLMQRASALYGELLEQRGGEAELQLQHARLLRQTAEILDALGRDEEGRVANARAEAIFRAELEARPTDATRVQLADTLVDGADPLRRAGEREAALARYAEAEALLDAVLGREPPDASLQHYALGGRRQLRANVAQVHLNSDEVELALAALDEALADCERMRACGHPRAAWAALHTRQARAAALDAARRDDEARAAYAELFDELRGACESARDPHDLDLLSVAAQNYGMSLFRADRIDEFERVLGIGLAMAERVGREHPYVPEYQERLATFLGSQAMAHVARGEVERALPFFERRVQAAERFASLRPFEPELELDLAEARHNHAAALLDAGRAAQAIAPSALASARLESAYAQGETRFAGQSVQAALVHAAARLATGEYPDAAALAQLVEQRAAAQPRVWSSLASVIATASARAAGDEALAPDERAARAEHYALTAVAALERALDAGYSTRSILDRTHELDCLRERADFQALMQRLPQ